MPFLEDVFHTNDIFRRHIDELGPYSDTIERILFRHIEVVPLMEYLDTKQQKWKLNHQLKKSSTEGILVHGDGRIFRIPRRDIPVFRRKRNIETHHVDIRLILGHSWFSHSWMVTTARTKGVGLTRLYNFRNETYFEMVIGHVKLHVDVPSPSTDKLYILYHLRPIDLNTRELPDGDLVVLKPDQLLKLASKAGLEKVLDFKDVMDTIIEEFKQNGRNLISFDIFNISSQLIRLQGGFIDPNVEFCTANEVETTRRFSQYILQILAERIREYKCYSEELSELRKKYQRWLKEVFSMSVCA